MKLTEELKDKIFFTTIRYIGFGALLVSYLLWGSFATDKYMWPARALFAGSLLMVFLYHKYVWSEYTKRREIARRAKEE